MNMKITYNKNPLRSTVELDDSEKEIFRLKIKIKEYEDNIIFDAYYHLNPERESYNPAGAFRALDVDYWCNDEPGKANHTKLDTRVDELLHYYIEELMHEHSGDCTCVACSCSKCNAESILGIDTIPCLGKHSAYKINDAFGKDQSRSLDEAIEYLRTYEPTATWNGWEAHAERWKVEATAAYEWLKNYRDTYFPQGQKDATH